MVLNYLQNKVLKITSNSKGYATGVIYVNNKKKKQQKTKIIILACGGHWFPKNFT